MNLKGKIAIVTGGSQGIGKSIASALLHKGARVAIVDVDDELGEQTKAEFSSKYSEGNVLYIHCDVSNKQQFERVFLETKKKFERVDILVNNAGITNEKNWEKMADINLGGVLRGTKLAFEHLGTSDNPQKGVVINIGSILGLWPINLLPTYSAIKEAVIAFTIAESLPMSVERTGVKLNVVCPAAVLTSLHLANTNPSNELISHPDLLLEACKTVTPLQPSAVADAIVKLLEDGTNGAVVHVSNSGAEYIEFPEPIPIPK